MDRGTDCKVTGRFLSTWKVGAPTLKLFKGQLFIQIHATVITIDFITFPPHHLQRNLTPLAVTPHSSMSQPYVTANLRSVSIDVPLSDLHL